MNNKRISLLIVDDHAMFRMGLKSLFGTSKDVAVVGDAASGEEALKQISPLKPDVVIMDLQMAGMDGAEATRQILARHPDTKVLILTTFGTSDGLAHALEAGAKGALLKTAEFAELLAAVKSVACGETAVSDEVRRILADDPPVPPLSPRQREILSAIIDGLTNAEIASKLDISLPMVKEHVSALFAKLDVATRADAVAIALRKHLLKL